MEYRNFELVSKFKPAGDQQKAIDKLCENLEDGLKSQILLGVTGSGKTFTMANVIAKLKEDFLSGIKDNKIQCIFIGLTTGILAFLFNVIRIYSNSGWLDAIPFGFIFFGFYPVLIHAFFMNSIYTNKFSMNLKAGAFCYFKFFNITYKPITFHNCPKLYCMYEKL